MRSSLLLIIASMLLLTSASGQVPSPLPGWPYVVDPVDFYIYSVPRFGVDGDWMALYFNTLTGEVDKFHLDRTFYHGWPLILDSLMFDPTPIVVDIDHDGYREIVTSAKTRWDEIYSFLYLIDNEGQVMSGFPIQTRWPSFINVIDLDADNEYEILVYDPTGDMIHCIDEFGRPKPGWPLYFHMPGVESVITGGPFLGDLDLDGNNEYLISGLREIFAFRYDGTPQPGFPISLDEDSTFQYHNNGAPPNLADIDGDGYLEIITSGNNWSPLNPLDYLSFIVIYEHDGTVKNGWPHHFSGIFILHTPTPADINGDGFIELGYQMGESLNFVDSNLVPLPGWPVSLYDPDGLVRGSTSDLVSVDLDGDGDSEILTDHNGFYADSMGNDSILYYGHGYLFAVDHLGQDLAGYPVEVAGAYFRKPPTFALEPQSNRLHMSLATEFLMPNWMDTIFVELYAFPDSTGPTTEWPMLGHDNLMTRNYNFVDRVTSVHDEGMEILPNSPILRQNYPNPFNLSTIIEFTLPEKKHVTLSVYDILGRRVVDLYDQELDAGTHRHRLSLDVPNGVYIYRLLAEKTQITRKMTLLK